MYRRFRILGLLTLLLGLLASPALAEPVESSDLALLAWVEAAVEWLFAGPSEKYGTFVEPGGVPADDPQPPEEPEEEYGTFVEPGG